MTQAEIDISVVIGFRDWGLDRLVANIALHFRHGAAYRLEVIVSDYGSANPDEIRTAVEAAGGRVVRSETGGRNWNRSAALNAGVSAARGRFVITTDADIFFTPQTYNAVVERLTANPRTMQLVQCRDLPEHCGIEYIQKFLDTRTQIDFAEINRMSTLRPRWGMGGLAAFTPEAFAALNGYESRMEVWGKEDTDFVKRMVATRLPARWLSRPDTGIYHIWHESSQTKARSSEESNRILRQNQDILDNDLTRVRNRAQSFVPEQFPVSIVVPTYQRVDYLRQCLQSCQAQTAPNFEVVIVENGGASGAEDIVAEFNDPRFRLIRTEKAGAAAARNIGVCEARGQYLVIMDDDDMMVSTRVEDHLAALTADVHGTYSGWIDFDDATGEVAGEHPGKRYGFDALWSTGKVIVHASLMIEKNAFRMFPYNETLTSGIDYGLLLQMSFNGLKLAHTGKFGLLRRLHGTNLTNRDSDAQKAAARQAVADLKALIPEEQQQELRKTGRDAQSMVCTNAQAAQDELALYRRGSCPPAQFTGPARQARIAQEIGPFDPDWYLSRYPDVAASGLDPWIHFHRYGRLLGRSGIRPEET